jgi:hypothetical protein
LDRSPYPSAVATIHRLAENAGWDDALLVAELKALTLDGFAIDMVGFSDSDIDRLLRGARGRDDEDNVPPTLERAVTVDGDVWLLGVHRLACGDSTRAESRRRRWRACGPRSWSPTRPMAWTIALTSATGRS